MTTTTTTSSNNKTLGERIRAARQAANMTMAGLGERIGISAQAVEKWESGQSAPSYQNLVLVTELLGFPAIGPTPATTDLQAKERCQSAATSSTAAPATTQVSPLWATLPDKLKAMAAKAGVEIVACDKSFGMVYGGDLISDDITLDQLDNFLQGCLVGQDHFDVPALVEELAKAEQIIQTLTANMSDGQRTKATNSLEAVGFPMRHAMRCRERHDLIAATRQAMSTGNAA